MSCGCSNSPCNCQPRPSVCCTPTTESVEYTFENGNLAGIGCFDNETDNLVQFRGIVSDSSSLSVALNATDNTIVLSFDSEALVTDIPNATTTQRGILETATNAEALAKAATDKILTPSNLAAIGATDTFAGLAEFATVAEAQAGVSSTLAVTPAGLSATIALSNTVVWADDAARGGLTPAFTGQFGFQGDKLTAWVGTTSFSPGSWIPLLTLGTVYNAMPADTTLGLGGFTFLMENGSFTLSSVTNAVTNCNTTFSGTGTTIFNGSSQTVTFDGGSQVNFQDAFFSVAGTPVTANSVIIQDVFLRANSLSIQAFLSSQNTQAGYTTFANPATLRTCDTATVTLPQLAQLVGTLIEDLKARLLPAT